MDHVKFLRDAAMRTKHQAVNINPCADADDKMKTALLDRAAEWDACAGRLEDQDREIRFLQGKLEIAEDAIKETASRAHNRLATLQDMKFL